jgi:cellulose synthase/poly-beta-1,6-N-acetylglucosamine synthase-like glycosyltransferase
MVAVALAIACALVLLETALFFAHLTGLRRLDRAPAFEPAHWPRVSVVMAACDEARDIAAAVASRLADDYPNLELILVDDRSGDGTGRIASEAAAGDPRFVVVRVDELPAGWLGKIHALHRGAERATGEWLLFSDGDVTVRPGTLRRAIACCLAEKIDLLALVPTFGTGDVMIDAVWTVFMRGMLVIIDPRLVRSPRSKVAMGSGAFNLVRREALDRTPGFEHLRLETGDDVALGLMVKRTGGHVELMDGSRHVSVPMYRSVGGFLRGLEKNGSTLARFPLPVLVGALVLLWTLVFAPLGAIAVGPAWLRLLGAVALAAYTAGELAALFSNTRRWLPALLWPLGGLIMSYGLARSAWLAKRNGGVRWRGTFYSLEELTRGRRV